MDLHVEYTKMMTLTLCSYPQVFITGSNFGYCQLIVLDGEA